MEFVVNKVESFWQLLSVVRYRFICGAEVYFNLIPTCTTNIRTVLQANPVQLRQWDNCMNHLISSTISYLRTTLSPVRPVGFTVLNTAALTFLTGIQNGRLNQFISFVLFFLFSYWLTNQNHQCWNIWLLGKKSVHSLVDEEGKGGVEEMKRLARGVTLPSVRRTGGQSWRLWTPFPAKPPDSHSGSNYYFCIWGRMRKCYAKKQKEEKKQKQNKTEERMWLRRWCGQYMGTQSRFTPPLSPLSLPPRLLMTTWCWFVTGQV